MTDNLDFGRVSATQNQKEVTQNAAYDAIDSALSAEQAFDVGNDNAHTISTDDFRDFFLFTANPGSPPPTGASTLTVPAVSRGSFAVFNNTAQDLTVTISGQSATPPVVMSGEVSLLVSDGSDVRGIETAVSGGSGAVSSVSPGTTITPSFQGAAVRLTSNESISTASNTDIPWDVVTFDTDSFWSGGSPTRLTVPSGVTKVRVSAGIEWGTSAVGQRAASITKNGSFSVEGRADDKRSAGDDSIGHIQNIISATLSVVSGDYFEVNVFQDSGGNLNVLTSAATWFAIEVVETINNTSLESVVVAAQPRLKGAYVTLSSDNVAFNASGAGAAFNGWDEEQYDTDNFWVGGTPSRLTVPGGVSKIRVGGNIEIANGTADEGLIVQLGLNGSTDHKFNVRQAAENSGLSSQGFSFSSGPIPVVQGDYFEIFLQTEVDTSIDIQSERSNFWIEVVEELGATDAPNAFIAVQPKSEGVVVRLGIDSTISNSTPTLLPWDTLIYDTKFQPNDTGPPQRFWLGVDADFVDGDVNVGNDTITETAHGFVTGEGPVRLTTTGVLPTGLATATDYWVIVVDVDTLKFASSRANALSDTSIDITAASGGGTHTIDSAAHFVIPEGVTKVRMNSSIQWEIDATGIRDIGVRKEGASFIGSAFERREAFSSSVFNDVTSSVLEVNGGERYEIEVQQTSGGVLDVISGNLSFFGLEVIETDKSFSFPGVTVERPHIGCSLRHSTTQTGLAASTSNPVEFDTELFDTGHRGVAFHDTVTNNSRITIPAGITKVKFEGGSSLDGVTGDRNIELYKNGSALTPRIITRDETDTIAMVQSLASGVLEVAENDYFELRLFHGSGTGSTLSGISWFTMTVIETDEAAEPPEPIDVYLDTWMTQAGSFPTSDAIYKKIANRRFSMNDDLAGSTGQADNGPNGGNVDIDVQRNGSSIGTISFADSTGAAQTATFTTSGSGQENFEVGDRLELIAPSNWQSMDEIVISLWAFRT